MKKLFTILTLFICLFANAATYYISPSGNDATGNGSISSPWKTLYKATTAVTSPGNIIHVNAGTYLETQVCSLAPGVSLEGEGITSVLQSTVTADWTPLLMLSSNSLATNGNQSISYLKFDGRNLATFWAVDIYNRKNVSMHHCTILNFKDRGVIFGNGNGGDNANNAPAVYATGNSFHDNDMRNCAAYNTANGVYGRGCLNIGGQEGMLIYNNYISQKERPQGYNGWPIKYWNGGFLNGCKIYDNVLDKIMNHSYNGNGAWDFAIELFWVQGLEIYGNTMTGGGVDLNYQDKGNYNYSAWVHHNTVTMPVQAVQMQTGVTLEYQSESVIVEDNIFDKVTIGVNYTPRPGSNITNNIIRRNLMTNIADMFIGFGDGGSNMINTGLEISNNTMVKKGNNSGWWGISLPHINSGTCANIVVKNNIIIGSASGGITQYSPVGINGLQIINNCMYNNGNNNVPVFTNAPPPTNYTYANNLFVAAGFVSSTDYHLAANSPLKGKGSDGNDIGCYIDNTPPPPACTFTYGLWSVCNNGLQTRSYVSTPMGCTGMPPLDSISRSCTPPPVPCTFTYGPWSACGDNGLQVRGFTTSPAGCTGNPPQDSVIRNCTPPPPPVQYLTVSSTNPPGEASPIPTTTKVSFIFSESLDASTVNTSTISLKKGGVAQAFTVSVSGSRIYITPKRVYTMDAIYTIELSTNIKSMSGKSLQQPYIFLISREQKIYKK